LLVGREFFDPFDIPLQRSLLWAILGFECIRIAVIFGLAYIVDDGSGTGAPSLRAESNSFASEVYAAEL
jgi:hypothetical protein